MDVSLMLEKQEKMSVIGLGYVGLPLAVEFAKKLTVIGFDTNRDKLNKYHDGIDVTNEVGDAAIQQTTIQFTSDEKDLAQCSFHIIAVPTPIKLDKSPDLDPVIAASRILGRNLRKGSVVVYESTVYPGVTEEICLPILEQESNLKAGVDFKVGYSPERINPGDKIHTLINIVKVVSGMDRESLSVISTMYKLIIEAGVFEVSSIKVAEAAKVVENSQRDVNIAFMNELAMAFEKMGIQTKEVIDAMNTKWNALGFMPGLVGGHCIGIDPYYFIYQAQKLGYHSQIILSGRKINDGMSEFVANQIVKRLALANKTVAKCRVGIIGVTFKENCGDCRNTKVVDIVKNLQEYGVKPLIYDPVVDKEDFYREYKLNLCDLEDIKEMDCLVLAVPHKEILELFNEDINAYFKDIDMSEKIIIDVKSALNANTLTQRGYTYWSL